MKEFSFIFSYYFRMQLYKKTKNVDTRGKLYEFDEFIKTVCFYYKLRFMNVL